jgi:pentose-5-phosphate-3-epimerase
MEANIKSLPQRILRQLESPTEPNLNHDSSTSHARGDPSRWDQELVMTVNPGFGHQHFLHSTLAKIRRVRQMIDQVKPECDLEVDGGIDEETAPLVVAAAANVLVAGTSVFGAGKGVAAAMKRLQTVANAAANEIQR